MFSYKNNTIFVSNIKLTLTTMRGNQNQFFTTKFIPMRKYIALCLMLSSILYVNAQFQVQYTHVNPLKFSLEDFNRIQIISANDQASVRVRYSLIDDQKKKVCDVFFKLLPMVRGMNQLNYSAGELVWHNSPYRDLLIKNQLVSGSFQVCVAVSDVYETLNEADECFEVELQSQDIVNDLNLNPIELQSPAHKDTIDEIRPMLTWIPPSPTYQGTQYQILLVEKKANQTCTEALNNNLPLVTKKDVLTNILNYPVESPALQKGSNYCWRASAHKDLKEYSRSEDWEFWVRGEKQHSNKGAPYIEEINGLTLYSRNNEFKFAFTNYSNQKKVLIKMNDKFLELDVDRGVNIIALPMEDIQEGKKVKIECILNNQNLVFYVQKN